MSNRRSLRLLGESTAIAKDFERAEEVVLEAGGDIAEAWQTLRNKRKEVPKSYLLWGFQDVIGDQRVTRVAEVYMWLGFKEKIERGSPRGKGIMDINAIELPGFDPERVHKIEINMYGRPDRDTLNRRFIQYVDDRDEEHGPKIDALLPQADTEPEDDPEEALEGAYEDNPMYEAESPGPVPEAVPSPAPTPDNTPRSRSEGPPKPLALRITEFGPAASPIMRMPRRKQSTSIY